MIVDGEGNNYNPVTLASFGAALFAGILTNLSIEARSSTLNFSLVCLVGALPALVMAWRIAHDNSDLSLSADHLITLVLFPSMMSGYAGIVLMAFHADRNAGVTFLLASAISVGVLLFVDRSTSRRKAKTEASSIPPTGTRKDSHLES